MATTTPITFSGLNGFDFSSIIDATIQSESIPMQNLQSQQDALKNKDAALTSLGSQVSQLESTISKLARQTSFTNVAGASSDTTIANVTTGDGAIAGTYQVSITNTAKAQVTASTTGYANTTDVVADGGSLSFTIGGQTTTAIQISSQTTLGDLANQINAQNSGVFAAVVNDGTNNKLVVMSRQTGQSNGFTINNGLTNSAGTTVAFAAGQSATTGNSQNAVDAQLTVNGLNITSASNAVNNAIPGTTLNLVKAGDTTVNVTADYSGLEDTFSSLVSQYNSLQQFVTQQSAVSNGQQGPLANDPVVRQIMNDVRSRLLASSGGGKYQYLSEIGLGFNSDGTMTFDKNSFDAAVNANPKDVQTLFQGPNGNNGLFNVFLTTMQADDDTNGLIASTKTSDQASLKNFADEIATQQLRLDMRRTQLTKLYSAADQAMIQLRASAQSLSQIGSTQSLF
jgi:flagellar hook-associated protein 2